MGDLYFLVSRSPPGVDDGSYSPCRIKASKGPASDPVVAFVTASLGEKLMVGRGIGSECQIVALGGLEPSIAADAKKQPILLFDTPELVASYLEQGPGFPFHAHITHFEDAYARAQRAL